MFRFTGVYQCLPRKDRTLQAGFMCPGGQTPDFFLFKGKCLLCDSADAVEPEEPEKIVSGLAGQDVTGEGRYAWSRRREDNDEAGSNNSL